jgi:hypothetical protein
LFVDRRLEAEGGSDVGYASKPNLQPQASAPDRGINTTAEFIGTNPHEWG